MKKKIVTLKYNWFQTGEGEDYHLYTLGEDGIKLIEEHKIMVEGDKWFYIVHFEDGSSIKVFNPNQVYFEEDHEKKHLT